MASGLSREARFESPFYPRRCSAVKLTADTALDVLKRASAPLSNERAAVELDDDINHEGGLRTTAEVVDLATSPVNTQDVRDDDDSDQIQSAARRRKRKQISSPSLAPHPKRSKQTDMG